LNFLINTITHWDEPPRARHQLTYALMKKYPVIFVSANKTGFLKIEKKKVNDNLEIIIPTFPVDVRLRTKLPLINAIYQKWLFRKLRKWYPGITVINFDFTAHHIFKYFKQVVYYCNDDFVALSSYYPFIGKYHKRVEGLVASRSKFCVVTSEHLKNKLLQFNPQTYEIRLGGPDIRNYNLMNGFIPNENGIVTAVFLGFLSTASVEIINGLVQNPNIQLVVIGPEKNAKGISSPEKIHFKGMLTGYELYAEMSKAHVGIIPYSLESKIDRTPNKLWQYFAVGKPVVITDIYSLKDWVFPVKFLYKAKDVSEFVENIFTAVAENNKVLTEARINESFQNTWEKRADDFIEICKANNLIPFK
jgi:hypothetical protein